MSHQAVPGFLAVFAVAWALVKWWRLVVPMAIALVVATMIFMLYQVMSMMEQASPTPPSPTSVSIGPDTR
jgi:hypothetical protein